jgi:hypothetical protein
LHNSFNHSMPPGGSTFRSTMNTVPPPSIMPGPMMPPAASGADTSRTDRAHPGTRAARAWLLEARVRCVCTRRGSGLGFAMTVKRTYRAECIVAVRSGFRMGGSEGESSARRAARVKDMLHTSTVLEQVIKQYDLYPSIRDRKGMPDAVAEMRLHVGFRHSETSRYVISFDYQEVPGRDVPDLVKDVAESLGKALVDEFSMGSVGDLRRQEGFLLEQVRSSEHAVEKATQDLTTFLSKHPEFALQATPLGLAPHPMGSAAGARVPLPPGKNPPAGAKVPAAPPIDPALLAIYQADPTLSALYRERQRLSAELRSAAPAPAPTGAPVNDPALQTKIAAAQAEADAATRQLSEAQADVSAKEQAKLTPDHPDMRAAQGRMDAAVQRLRAARSNLAALKAQQNQGSGTPSPGDNDANAELRTKLRDVESQIAAREADLKAKKASGTLVAPPPQPADAAVAPVLPTPSPTEPVSPFVALEGDWQRFVRVLGQSRSKHEELKRNHERVRLELEAAENKAAEMMQIVEHATRPTQAYKGGRGKAAIGGGVFAILLALLYMAARVVFNDRVIDAGDIEGLNLIPVLGTMPRISDAKAVVAKGEGKGSARVG